MDFGTSCLAVGALIFVCSCLWFIATQLFFCTHLPPGPLGLPILGNLLQIGSQSRCHQILADLASKYGPVMTLRFGGMTTVVISSPDAAREMFKVHDLALAGRTVYEAMKIIVTDQNNGGTVISSPEGSMISSQYGPSLRLLRRLFAHELFSNKRLNATKCIRRECLEATIRFIREESEDGKKAIDVEKFVYLTIFNVIGNLVFSRNLVDPKCKEANEFFDLASKIMILAAEPNIADFIPILKWFDPQGLKRELRRCLERVFEIITGFIEERTQAAWMSKEGEEKGDEKDYLDVLLSFRGQHADEPAKLPATIINSAVVEIFVAGTDTTTKTVEWALSELLHNPAAMAKLQSELFQIVGGKGNILEDEDIEKLPYLRAVVKESLRLRPSAPLLIPHKAMESCFLMGYHIPKDTQVLVNAWAIGRDPQVWEDPHCFKPERFLDSNLDYKGHHFQFIPFGSGRRMCAGMPLAHRMVPQILGTLVLSFDWILPDGLKPETMDMRERLGLSLGKTVPLKAIPLPRAMEKSVN